jgi:putative flippase GtrA
MNGAVVIPAFEPGLALLDVVAGLRARGADRIVVVDDGSSASCGPVFSELEQSGVEVTHHAVNLGKGAALRTGFNFVLCRWPDTPGVVTADADGQHAPQDVMRVAQQLEQEGNALVLGVRAFSGDVPWQNKAGNILSRWLVRLVVGQPLTDTQTGLRGVPAAMIPALLKIPSAGYEFELDMLITAKHLAFPIVQVPIQTIYRDGNRSSHFSPLRDSMKIYMVLFRFSIVAVLTAAIDNVAFWIAYQASGSIPGAQVVGRACAVAFNYQAARNAVFLSNEQHRSTLPKYLALVALNGFVSYAMIEALTSVAGFRVLPAKLLAEGILFVANFAIQRDFVFTRRRKAGATDWTAYYSKVPPTAKLTRRYTTSVLVNALRKYAHASPDVIEIGGANSCFLDAVLRQVQPRSYHVVDLNEYGLDLLRDRVEGRSEVVLHRQDVRTLALGVKADAVFSVGLIEHFDRAGTREAILSHLRLVAEGGIAILSYPTPTLLYRAARAITELLGLWNFPDERPLERGEVLESLAGHGHVVFEKTLWPLIFTQHFMVIQKLG